MRFMNGLSSAGIRVIMRRGMRFGVNVMQSSLTRTGITLTCSPDCTKYRGMSRTCLGSSEISPSADFSLIILLFRSPFLGILYGRKCTSKKEVVTWTYLRYMTHQKLVKDTSPTSRLFTTLA